MSKPVLKITALKPNAPLSSAAEVNLLISVFCPPDESELAKARPKLNLNLSIDKSGSMSGRPLAEAKLSAQKIVSSLVNGDRVSVTAYCNRIDVTVPSVVVSDENKASIIRDISKIHLGGNTNLHAGWLEAAKQAAVGLAPDVLTRVVLLSDGNANQGIRDIAEIARQAAALAEKGIATSTIGLGENFNETLMTELAMAGQGQANYGETADDLWPTFEAEFGLLSATCGKNVRLKLKSPTGAKMVVLNGYRQSSDGEWILPNLVYGAEINALVTLHVNDLAGDFSKLLEASLSYEKLDGTHADPLFADITLPLVSFADFVIGAPDAKVAERLKESEAADLQMKARDAAAIGDFDKVRELARKLAAMADGNAWLVGQSETLLELANQGNVAILTKEATYATTKLRQSYTTLGTPSDEDPQYLRRQTRQGKMA